MTVGIKDTMATRDTRATMATKDYVSDPQEILRRSFETVARETDLGAIPGDLHDIALRLVHATAMPELVRDLAFSTDAAKHGRAALAAGAPVLADCHMVAHGITVALLPNRNRVICTLDQDGVAAEAKRRGLTRSAVAVERWKPWIKGAVVAIGNAPTALFRLLELIDQGWDHPAVILGFPVGFIGAAEAKAHLAAHPAGVPFVSLQGRFGGSALAVAAVNALAKSAKAAGATTGELPAEATP